MADFEYLVSMTGNVANMGLLAELWHQKILEKYYEAAGQCLDGAEGDAPVGLTGDLRGSGMIDKEEYGVGEFEVDVSFGNGLPYTSKNYLYPESATTSAFPDGDMSAENYALIVELGHSTSNGGVVAPQPFLGPNFDKAALDLIDELNGILD